MPKAKPIQDMSVKELKAELKAYNVDFVAAGCVEKKHMRELLKKTREDKGWPPKKGDSSAKASSNADNSKGADKKSSSSSGFASGFFNSGSSASSSSGAQANKRINPTKQNVKASTKVAIVFDPDNDSVQECAQFIQPFFMCTPECTSSQGERKVPQVCWIMPVSLREELIRCNLPEQLAHFPWFTAIFVDDEGNPVDFEGEPVKLPESSLKGNDDLTLINEYVAHALRWGADWVLVRREGGIMPRLWLSTLAGVSAGAWKAARTPGVFALDIKWHLKNVIGDKTGAVFPEDLEPRDAWYYWLTNVYPESIVYELDEPEESEVDADRIMIACEEDQFKDLRAKLAK